KGGTIAVLGTPVDTVYPQENRQLYDDIAAQGVLVSEYPLGMKTHPGLFPRRNRIIAGLSLGTVVVEGGESSGSLITADYCLEASRDVFAVPGPITSPKSQGPLSLLRQGAKLAAGVEDILEDYAHRLSLPASGPTKAANALPPLADEEQEILRLIASEPVSIEQLLAHGKF